MQNDDKENVGAGQQPAPLSAPTPSFRHREYGDPSKVWEYQSQDGETYGFICRYDTQDGKQFCPRTWNGKDWVWKGFGTPRPLYNLPDLAARTSAQVIISEGEKAADAIKTLFPGQVSVTWPGGANAVDKADWTPLKGRSVLLWPDADNAGKAAMNKLGAILIACGVPYIKTLNVEDLEKGWDAADFVGTKKEALEFIKHRVIDYAPPVAVKVDQKVVSIDTKRKQAKPREKPVARHDWVSLRLDLNERNVPVPSLDNCVRVLQTHQDLSNAIWYDEFLNRIQHTWGSNKAVEWSDTSSIALALYFQREIGIPRITKSLAMDAVIYVAGANTKNCARDYFESLKWDGQYRLMQLAKLGFGAEDNDYTQQVCRNFILSMVKRVMQPGCKADYMPVFEGDQGAGKSDALSILGGEWFAESHSIFGKDFVELIQGKVLIEISEMHAFNQADVERIKGMITCKVDRYRAPYERTAKDYPRSCVLAGTTNRDDWNRDETGARRFLPIKCRKIDKQWLHAHRDQLFAEAVYDISMGKSHWEIPFDKAKEEQDARLWHDSWSQSVSNYLVGKNEITMTDLLLYLDIPFPKHDIITQRRVGRLLSVFGWKNTVCRRGMKTVRVWCKTNQNVIDNNELFEG